MKALKMIANRIKKVFLEKFSFLGKKQRIAFPFLLNLSGVAEQNDGKKKAEIIKMRRCILNGECEAEISVVSLDLMHCAFIISSAFVMISFRSDSDKNYDKFE